MLETLLNSTKLQELHTAFQNGDSVLIEGLWNAPKALITAIAQKATGKHIVILTGGSLEEAALYHDFPVFTNRPIVDFPAWETLPTENVPPSPDIVGERYQVLENIIQSDEPHIIITSLQACLQKLIDSDAFCSLHLSLKVGDTHPFDAVINQLKSMGYVRTPVASDKGEYAVRGGIIDIFPVSSPDPHRIEFFGDDIDSIRIYDPIGQKTVRKVDHFSITPAQELEFLEKHPKLSTIFDYLGPKTLVVFDDLLALEDRYANIVNMLGTKTHLFCTWDEFLTQQKSFQKIYLTTKPIEELTQVKILDKVTNVYSDKAPMHAVSFEMFQANLSAKRWNHPFLNINDYLFAEEELSGEEMLQGLAEREGGKFHLLCATELEESNLHKKILESQITLPEGTNFQLGYLSHGFAVVDIEHAILPYTEISHRYKIRRQKLRSTYHTVPSQAYELNAGDHIVHFNHGVGKYLGLEKRPDNTGVVKEFFLLEYAKESKLFVPLNQAHLLTKYIGATGEVPALHTIGSGRWLRTREKTQQAIICYASELLDHYAKREMHGGFEYDKDSEDTKAFEEDFPFVETADQLEAVAGVKSDMCSKKPMDRLVCGDVGYGKTEVAMRAAFKAVVDGGKQVAILVPTTVLALQHYENFCERMANFPINIGVLSRFVKAKDKKETLKGVQSGLVDILIGTHRIVSGDVKFKNLGLIVIDEEQRFGVKVKEQLKSVKIGVDCLTLSATPIPRTLYMSLIGARDMSVINTPPQDRLPIKTVITEYNEKTIKNALLRELARDGQSYVIHNRVDTIYELASRIKKMVPQARVVIGHGQMSANELDTVFHAFKSGEADILVATTIVENGIDIPNANTILIDHADHFGLADLYQLRGRVGRWNRRAYAYFLVKNLHTLPEISRQRLNALAETSGYGGGMKIAMRDLEIRGAGDILGYEQSGNVSSIGFHLYCKMLKRTIKTMQGKLSAGLTEAKIDSNIDARIPETYVNEVSLRMEFYQRLGEAVSWDEVNDIWEELYDRFGKPPEQALRLYHLTRIRIFAAQKGITSVKIEKLSVTAENNEGNLKKALLKPSKTPDEWEENVLEILNKL